MTSNQINYAKLQEEARHNYEVERYNARMASAAEANAESNRQNVAINARNSEISARNAETNYQNMLISGRQVDVNASAVGVQAAQVAEMQRHNYISEEQNEAHIINEAWNTGANWLGKIGNIFKGGVSLLT